MAEQAVSPMMQQYFEIKKQHPNEILFYRVGDFYEMFYDDALTASRELELTLTGKNCGKEERAPMCGVPFHSYETYVARLIAKGYKVAICEQMEEDVYKRQDVGRRGHLGRQRADGGRQKLVLVSHLIQNIAHNGGVQLLLHQGEHFVVVFPHGHNSNLS